MTARELVEKMIAESQRVRSGIPKGKFRVVLCDRFSEESAIIGHTDTLEDAAKWADGLNKPENMEVAYVFDDGGSCVYEAKKQGQTATE